ncbi:MAG: CDP-alcohol phosphatidyltransferase family protein [Terriglobales bacterium]
MSKSNTATAAAHSRARNGIVRAREKAQPKPSNPNFTDIPYRKVSIYFSLQLARLGVTANAVTVSWICLGVIADVLLGSSNYSVEVVAAVVLQMSYLLDFVDGEVARLQEQPSRRGVFLDLAGHATVKCGIFLGIAYGVVASSWSVGYVLLALLACLSLSSLSVLPTMGLLAGVSPWKPRARHAAQEPSRIWRRLQGITGIPFESPGVYGLLLLAMVLQKTEWLLLFYGICGPLRLLFEFSQYRYDPAVPDDVHTGAE